MMIMMMMMVVVVVAVEVLMMVVVMMMMMMIRLPSIILFSLNLENVEECVVKHSEFVYIRE